ncbi:ABC transporter permease subunit [Enterobacter cloacae subsp. cloacae]|nr:ABC transporter permease subunit [Enterobacter cloacae subsp. cloacae]
MLLIVFLPAASYFDLFPLRAGIRRFQHPAVVSENHRLSLWHITLPVLATVIGGFAALTMLTKNAFLDETRKQYVVTARAKGVGETDRNGSMCSATPCCW